MPSLLLGEGKGSWQRQPVTGMSLTAEPSIDLWGSSPPAPAKQQPGDAPSPKDIAWPGHVLAGVGENPGGSSLAEWDRSEGGCWAAGQTVPGPPWEDPESSHPTLGNMQVSQGRGPTLSRTKTEIFLLRHPRRRYPRSIYPRSRCRRRRESHLAVCERLPAPTCKNKLGNWDQLPSLYVSKLRRCLSPALLCRAAAGPSRPLLSLQRQTEGTAVSPRKRLLRA